MSVASMSALQEFIYTGEVKSTDFKVLQTLGKMADEFKIVGLKDRCIRQAILKLGQADPEQYLDYYRLSKQFNSPDLLKMAVDVYERYYFIKLALYPPVHLPTTLKLLGNY